MLSDPTILIVFSVVNAIAIAMAYVAWRWMDWGRLWFAVMFFGAGIFNYLYSMFDPEEYIYYSDFAMLDIYRDFIIGLSTPALRSILVLVAIGQVLTGIGLISKGIWTKLAAIAGSVFLLAIAPLGVGAFFPSTLIMCVGLYFLFRRDIPYSLFFMVRSRLGKTGVVPAEEE